MKKLIIACVAMAMVAGCGTQPLSKVGCSGAAAPKSDKQWLETKHGLLAAVESVTNLTSVGLNSGGERSGVTFTYSPKKDGLLVFEDGSWVLLESHSINEEDGLGDLTLIRTSEGKYHLNRGHVCGLLNLEAKERITSLATFLKAKGKGAKAKPVPWEPYEDAPVPHK